MAVEIDDIAAVAIKAAARRAEMAGAVAAHDAALLPVAVILDLLDRRVGLWGLGHVG
jgi:hypothetical protein